MAFIFMNMLGNKQNNILENAFIDKISNHSLKNLITSILRSKKNHLSG